MKIQTVKIDGGDRGQLLEVTVETPGRSVRIGQFADERAAATETATQLRKMVKRGECSPAVAESALRSAGWLAAAELAAAVAPKRRRRG